MAWHELTELDRQLTQWFPEALTPYSLHKIAEILSERSPSCAAHLTYSRIYKIYRALLDHPATRTGVEPMFPHAAATLLYFDAPAARRIARRAISRCRSKNCQCRKNRHRSGVGITQTATMPASLGKVLV